MIPSGYSSSLPSASRTPELAIRLQAHDGLGEAISTLAPDVDMTRVEEVDIIAEVDTSTQQDLGKRLPKVIKEGLG